jgi:hypothetical protein
MMTIILSHIFCGVSIDFIRCDLMIVPMFDLLLQGLFRCDYISLDAIMVDATSTNPYYKVLHNKHLRLMYQRHPSCYPT